MSEQRSHQSPQGVAVEARDIVRTFQIGDNRIEVLKSVSLTVKQG